MSQGRLCPPDADQRRLIHAGGQWLTLSPALHAEPASVGANRDDGHGTHFRIFYLPTKQLASTLDLVSTARLTTTMKFAAVASAAALVAVANAASCDVTSLTPLLSSTDTTTCASDSGYTVTSLATPTDAEMTVMCSSTACQSVLTQLQSLAPSECTLGTFALYADLITPLTTHCSGASSTAGSTATTAGSTATTAGSSGTTATVGSTAGSSTSATVTTSSTGSAASTTTTSTTSSGSSTSQTATSSSAASAAASASTSGSSGASMAAVSAGAVLAAVAAAFF
ncbi:hypothetical protein PHYPSEUDO_013224 [Phytophthora pseudosyringae]|uniref:Elicitin n=1 Tax=Phytophthora pseudosyringae TaxID=221518 RepID=A0A8T1V5H2_9STRA|nr:hypothetical protein PHYPSEUDO_013224 [Phytophthora pseudosyringae]